MSRNFGSNKGDVKNSFSGSGLAANLPSAAEMGRRGNDDLNWGRGDSKPGTYRPPRQETATAGPATTSYARRSRQSEETGDDVDDKWSKAFKSSPRPGANREPSAPSVNESLPMNTRATGMRGFSGSAEGERPEGRPIRSFGGDRPPLREHHGPWGEDKREDRGEREDQPPREDRPPREYREDRPQREYREDGGRFGGRRSDRPDRGFGGGDREERHGFGGDREERRAFGNGDARNDERRGPPRGGRGGRGRPDDREWESDPRFASKFGRDLNPRFDNSERQRGWEGPLPTAPKASLDAGKSNVAGASPIPIFKVVPPKVPKDKKEENENNSGASTPKPADVKAEKRKAEEEARKAKLEAEKLAKDEQNNKLSFSYAATLDAIKSGLKGSNLTDHVKESIGNENHKLSSDGVLKAILHSLNDKDFTTKWYDNKEYGNILSSSLGSNKSHKEQVQLLYIVQEFCHSKKFPKIEFSKGVQKKLIELLITNLLVSEIVDVEGIIAWADDESDNDYPGRGDAIIQTTGMIGKLRESLQEEEEEEDGDDSDLDFDTPQAHV